MPALLPSHRGFDTLLSSCDAALRGRANRYQPQIRRSGARIDGSDEPRDAAWRCMLDQRCCNEYNPGNVAAAMVLQWWQRVDVLRPDAGRPARWRQYRSIMQHCEAMQAQNGAAIGLRGRTITWNTVEATAVAKEGRVPGRTTGARRRGVYSADILGVWHALRQLHTSGVTSSGRPADDSASGVQVWRTMTTLAPPLRWRCRALLPVRAQLVRVGTRAARPLLPVRYYVGLCVYVHLPSFYGSARGRLLPPHRGAADGWAVRTC